MKFDDWTAMSYGDARAHVYDRQVSHRGDVKAATSLLATLAVGRPALELGVGTGRLAIPLAATGLSVVGIDSSPRMLEQLARTPGGGRLRVYLADAAEFDMRERFGLVWFAFNSFFLLDDIDRQHSCLRAVARHLLPDGNFVVEVFVPRPSEIAQEPILRVKSFDAMQILLQASRHDPSYQRIESLDIELTQGGFELFPTRVRYCWPDQLDEMAASAGLQLEERWSSWARDEFRPDSRNHVSVYRLRS